MNKLLFNALLVKTSQCSTANAVATANASATSLSTLPSSPESSPPSTGIVEIFCGVNEERVECGPGCERSCENQNGPYACSDVCRSEGFCVCKDGFCRCGDICIPCYECPGASISI